MYCILVNSFKDKNIYISTLWSNSKVSEKNNNNNNLFLELKFYFPLFWGMVIYDNEFETKENKRIKIKPNHKICPIMIS